ncbi:hypothetical protein DY218_21675 [Streptomyces triticagri]|uniref:CsbD family protein n=1 Tax=Streptomyces triticagri TaxID=2293568 RepID=A0A372M2U1_9ACTN|nr:hypothetical protein [Streptomyces triticagri]RFU84607.1 hypothetical protein DY218_21675 [Streptomyces triticagri]
MTSQKDVLKAKLARLKAAKKKTDGEALGRERLRDEGRREGEAARSAEERAKSARRESRGR